MNILRREVSVPVEDVIVERDQLAERLRLPLLHYEHPLAEQLAGALDVAAEPSEAEYIEASRQGLLIHAQAQVERYSGPSIQGMSSVSAERAHLLESARQALHSRLEMGDQTALPAVSPDNDNLAQAVLFARHDIRIETNQMAAEIAGRITQRQQSLGRRLLQAVGFKSAITLEIPNSAEVNRRIGRLVDSLLAIGTPQPVVEKVVVGQSAAIEAQVRRALGDECRKISPSFERRSVERSRLAPYIPPAPEESTVDIPRQTQSTVSSKSESAAEEVILDPEEAEIARKYGELIGEIDSPFDWDDAQKLEVRLKENNGNSLVTIKAMSRNALGLSKKLRRDRRTADEFDALYQRIIDTELAGQTLTNKNVQKYEHIKSNPYDEFTVFKYTNTGPNAKRLFYVRDRLDRFNAVETILSDRGLSGATPVIVLIAESDIKKIGTIHGNEFNESLGRVRMKSKR